jgi:phage tail-like protein
MAILGSVGLRSDPLLAHNFLITLVDSSSSLTLKSASSAIADIALGGFSECSGLETTLDVEEYREGGRNGEVLQFPTRVRWSKLTLKKGMGAGTDLWDWHYGFVVGQGRRRDGVIALMNELQLPSHIWYFRRGLPTRYSGPSLNATQSAVAIETIEIAHEGLFQIPGIGFGGAAASAAVGAATKLGL